MNDQTVRLFHKADWIDNYVDTLTHTITSAIAENVPTKSIKRNSIGLPIEIRKLIRQRRGDFGKGPEYRSTRLTIIVYRNELAKTLLSERETAGKCTATIWSFPRVKMPPGVKSDHSCTERILPSSPETKVG